MSSITDKKEQSISGTQSPPLEATGSEKPMGVSSIDGTKHGHVSDHAQRSEYFGGSSDAQAKEKESASGGAQAKKVGQSLAQEVEERT